MTIIVGIICFVAGIFIGFYVFPISIYIFAKLKYRNTGVKTRYEVTECGNLLEIEED